MQETSINPFFNLPRSKFLKNTAQRQQQDDSRFDFPERKLRSSIVVDPDVKADDIDIQIVENDTEPQCTDDPGSDTELDASEREQDAKGLQLGSQLKREYQQLG